MFDYYNYEYMLSGIDNLNISKNYNIANKYKTEIETLTIVGWRWWGIYIRDIIGHAHSGLYDSTSDPSRFTFTDNNTDEHDDSDDDCQCEQPPYHRPGDRPHRATAIDKNITTCYGQ